MNGLKFMINRAMAEIDTINKVFAINRIEQIEEEVKKVKMMDLEFDAIKLKLDNKAPKE